jgi:dTDP-4-dehydrorhamnose reductase
VKKVLVTGGTGFVGSHVVEVLNHRGMHPVVATRSPLEASFPWDSIVVDYLNQESVESAVGTVDAVVHSAILNDFSVMQNNRRYAYDSYVVSTQNLSNAASDKPFVFISTDWVMDGTGHMVPEDEPPNPLNIYGVLKAFGEMVVKDRKHLGSIARVGGILGKHRLADQGPRQQDCGFGFFVTSMIEQLSKGKEFTVWMDDNVNMVASPSHATEIGASIHRMIEREVEGTFHLMASESIGRMELALLAANIFGLDSELITTGPVPPEGVFPAAVPRDTSLDCTQTRRILDLDPYSVADYLCMLKREMESGTLVPLTPQVT